MMPDAGPQPGASALICDVVLAGQLNHHGTLFAGTALSMMSRAAFAAASRMARSDVVMAACEQAEFCCPVQAGDLVEATATASRAGGRSMMVTVDVVAETLRTGDRRQALHGRFVMVSVEAPPGPAHLQRAGAAAATAAPGRPA